MGRFLLLSFICCLFLAFGCGKDEAPEKAKAETKKVQKTAVEQNKFTLPADNDKLKKYLDWQIESQQTEYLTFKASNIKKEVEVTIPAGSLFIPGDKNVTSYIATENTHFTVKPSSSGGERFGIKVMAVSLDHWGVSAKNIRFTIQAPEPKSKLYEYVITLNKIKKYDWLQGQIGAWVVNSNIPVEKLYNLRVQLSSGFLGMSKSVTRVYSHELVIKTAALLNKMGYKPDDYQLFTQNQQTFQKALSVYKLKDWNQRLKIGYVGNIFNSLSGYEDEIEVMQLIMEYLKNHNYAVYREQALEKLLDLGGVDGADDDLLDIALNSPNRMVRIAAALTLWQRNDKRVIPILMVYQYDEPIMAQVNFRLKKMVQDKTGKEITETQTLLPLWEKNNGWQGLEKDVRNIKLLKEGVKKLVDEEKSYLDQELAVLKNDDSKQFYGALAEIKRRFPYNKHVYNYIKDLSLTLKNNEFRQAAFKAVIDNKNFDHFEFLKDRIENDHYLPIKKSVLRCSAISKEQQIQLFVIALKCSDSRIRTFAANLIKQNSLKNDQLASLLFNIGRRSPNIDTRIAAMQALVEISPKKAYEIIKFNSKLKNKKYAKLIEKSLEAGSSQIKTEKMFELMKKVAKTHPLSKIRRYALGRLYLFQSKEPFVDVFINLSKNDPKESVRIAAVQDAAKLSKKKEFQDKGFDKVLKIGLKDFSEKVKKETISSIGQNKLVKLTPALEKVALKDDDDKIKEAAFLVVRKFDAEKAFKILKKWLKSKYPQEQKMAVNYLVRFYAKEKETKKLLAPFKKSDDKSIRQKVKKVLK